MTPKVEKLLLIRAVEGGRLSCQRWQSGKVVYGGAKQFTVEGRLLCSLFKKVANGSCGHVKFQPFGRKVMATLSRPDGSIEIFCRFSFLIDPFQKEIEPVQNKVAWKPVYRAQYCPRCGLGMRDVQAAEEHEAQNH